MLDFQYLPWVYTFPILARGWANKLEYTKHQLRSIGIYLSSWTLKKQWQAIPEYTILLKYFGTPGLRKVLLPMRWMMETGLVVMDAVAKAEDSEQRRVAATLEKIQDWNCAEGDP
ncbi:hypothetical protein [Rhodoferax lithotrophicus]|nr:hypothetical protein [Rhodoferax sp. MIZ03]